MNIDEILNRLDAGGFQPKKDGKGWTALCPAHGDGDPSLSVSEGGDGKILLHCHAECTVQAICDAIGIKPRDLFAEKRKEKKEIVATYDYTDEHGKLLYQAVRMHPKDFRQRKPKPSGGWDWSVKGERLVPYRLPQVIEAVEQGKLVLVVEGEKDVATAEKLGFVATCNVGGALKWHDDYGQHLVGADVLIIPDKDPDKKQGKIHRKGQRHGAQVVRSLHGKAKRCRVLEIPGDSCNDLTDWVERVKVDADAVVEVAKANAVDGEAYADEIEAWVRREEAKDKAKKDEKQRELEKVNPDIAAPEFTNRDQTDLGASDRLVQRYGDKMRYCGELRRWFVWDGSIWREDRTGQALARAKAVAKENTVRLILDDGDQRKALALEGASRIKGALELAAVDEKIAVTADIFDRHADHVACPNGTIDLRTGELVAPDPEMLLTQMVPTVYDADATCPHFMAFLDSIMLGDAEMVEFLRRWLGYCITGQTREQALVVAHGGGANGKGTLFDTVSDVIGPLATEAPQTLLMAKRQENHPAELMTVRGKRLVTASEVKKGSTWDEARLKWLTGQDTITARGMRQDFVSWQPTHKLTVYLNNKPRVRDASDAFWRRMLFVPFMGSFGPGQPGHDPLLRDKLRSEHSGILTWLVGGAVSWYADGLIRPSAVMQATEQYREDEDSFGKWLEDFLDRPNMATEQKASMLLEDYSKWCARWKESEMASRDFFGTLIDRGATKKKKKDGYYYTITPNEPGCRVHPNAPKYVRPYTRAHVPPNLENGAPGCTFEKNGEKGAESAGLAGAPWCTHEGEKVQGKDDGRFDWLEDIENDDERG